MRAVSLSNQEVIDTLNRYYVPVYLSNEDYRDGGAAPAEDTRGRLGGEAISVRLGWRPDPLKRRGRFRG